MNAVTEMWSMFASYSERYRLFNCCRGSSPIRENGMNDDSVGTPWWKTLTAKPIASRDMVPAAAIPETRLVFAWHDVVPHFFLGFELGDMRIVPMQCHPYR